MKIILKSSYPCLIKTANQQVEIEENDACQIEDESKIFVYPLTERMSFEIDLNNLKSGEFYYVFENHGQKYILLEKKNRLNCISKQRFSIGGKTCDVFIDENRLTFETSDKKLEYECNHSLQHAKTFKLKDFICVQTGDDFYAYSVKNNKLSHFNGEIELEGNILTVKKNFNDSEGRIRKAKYLLDNNIVVQSEEFERSKSDSLAQLVPFKLLESVKAHDFSHAMQFLSDRLRMQIDQQKIANFFGYFTDFLPVSTTEFITLSNKDKNFVSFSMIEDKIDDIDIDKL